MEMSDNQNQDFKKRNEFLISNFRHLPSLNKNMNSLDLYNVHPVYNCTKVYIQYTLGEFQSLTLLLMIELLLIMVDLVFLYSCSSCLNFQQDYKSALNSSNTVRLSGGCIRSGREMGEGGGAIEAARWVYGGSQGQRYYKPR